MPLDFWYALFDAGITGTGRPCVLQYTPTETFTVIRRYYVIELRRANQIIHRHDSRKPATK